MQSVFGLNSANWGWPRVRPEPTVCYRGWAQKWAQRIAEFRPATASAWAPLRGHQPYRVALRVKDGASHFYGPPAPTNPGEDLLLNAVWCPEAERYRRDHVRSKTRDPGLAHEDPPPLPLVLPAGCLRTNGLAHNLKVVVAIVVRCGHVIRVLNFQWLCLIRFRGHLPRGGYDGTHGIKHDWPTGAATVL